MVDAQYIRDLERWRGEVDEWRRAHDDTHESEDGEREVSLRERRRWSWPEIIVAVITASGVVAAATITALSR